MQILCEHLFWFWLTFEHAQPICHCHCRPHSVFYTTFLHTFHYCTGSYFYYTSYIVRCRPSTTPPIYHATHLPRHTSTTPPFYQYHAAHLTHHRSTTLPIYHKTHLPRNPSNTPPIYQSAHLPHCP